MKNPASWDIPKLQRTLLIGDDANLVAQFSSLLTRKHQYLPILDGPRIQRPDAKTEVIRRNNTAALIKPSDIIFAGLDSDTVSLFSDHFPSKITHSFQSTKQLASSIVGLSIDTNNVVKIGEANIGTGLLTALRERKYVSIDSSLLNSTFIPSVSGHIIVCEAGNELSQVIAANYAYSLHAGLIIIPEQDDNYADDILDMLYGLQESVDIAPSQKFIDIQNELLEKIQNLDLKDCTSLTFFTKKLPWGICFPHIPSTHIFLYPDVGSAVVHGIIGEQPESSGFRIGAVLEPGVVDAREVDTLRKSFTSKGVLIRPLRGSACSVRNAKNLIHLYPYDFLLISSHCGDASGWRWTYEFEDQNGIDRVFEMDVAIGVGNIPGKEKIEVTQYNRFISFDGVDWTDKEKIRTIEGFDGVMDYLFDSIRDNKIEPTKKVSADRVLGSSVLKMNDDNLLFVEYSIADNGIPIIFNNACASWHALSERFTYAGTRAYLGTLFSVTDAEATEIIKLLVTKYCGHPLSLALWHAQNQVYGRAPRRPYLLVGPHFQRLRFQQGDKLEYLFSRLSNLDQMLKDNHESLDEDGKRKNQDALNFLESEINSLEQHISQSRE